MWIWLTVLSAVLLGFYDIAKKQSLKNNSVLWILFSYTVMTCIFLLPFTEGGSPHDHLLLSLKGVLVSASWISGLVAMDLLPLTTVSTLKASRPMFVVLFSILIFGERLNAWQWAGVLLVLAALFLLSRSSKKEGIAFGKSKGVLWMAVSILSGVASALYDKFLLTDLSPSFVQFWGNFYIAIILGILLIINRIREGENFRRFKWDWMLLIVAVLITLADASYFQALKQDGAMLSVISMVRRCSVVVTFFGGALIFKEKRIADKAVELGILLVGLACLVFAS